MSFRPEQPHPRSKLDPADATAEGRRILVQGTVQGVGFRPWIYRLARDAGIRGSVRNGSAGVVIEAWGVPAALDEFVRRLETTLPPAASIRRLETQPLAAAAPEGFVIEASEHDPERRVSIPPDLATCPDCLREVLDPADRRHGYAFTNCTACGPRFSIARDVPYDRAATTMAGFTMCAECQAEYDRVEDRRFHAQPNACPRCGPRLFAEAAAGERLPEGEALAAAARALRAGRIVALKGIGGLHLACDARSSAAVSRLRARKRREEKPLAVMVPDLEAAERLAHLGPEERRLLTSVERPIVLARCRPGLGLAPEVAPGNPLLGLLLPYSPLHHLLLRRVEGPVVMTSGNLSEEPIARTNEEARRDLAGVADLLVLHDREIETRCDDSVVSVIAGRATVLRRSRGFVPRSVPVAHPFSRTVLACGAHLKNAFCFGLGEAAYLGPHVGDLETERACAFFEESVARMERFLAARPEVIAHDLHPGYHSTRYALGRPEALKVAVQHHHAHVVSGMAENGLAGPVLGVAYDGTGDGGDGTAWGGEILRVEPAGFRRIATFRPLPLAGGDLAVRQVWRSAVALLEDAFDGQPPLERLRLFERVPSQALGVVRQMIRGGVNAPLAHGVGRYFDGIGGLALERTSSAYEGQVALEWNLVADPGEAACYGFRLDLSREPWELDLREAVREVVRDLWAGLAAAVISARFHNTLVAATAHVVREALAELGPLPVVLTGGCFQNGLLAEGVLRELEPAAAVYRHGEVPPGDGGIALGQAVIADAVARDSL